MTHVQAILFPGWGAHTGTGAPTVPPALPTPLLFTPPVHTCCSQVFFELEAWDCQVACGKAVGTPCTRSALLVIFYLLCCAYLAASAQQVKQGLPLLQV